MNLETLPTALVSALLDGRQPFQAVFERRKGLGGPPIPRSLGKKQNKFS